MAKSRIKLILLLIFNLVLYYLFGKCFFVLLGTTICTYYLGHIIKKKKKNIFLIISLSIILLPLLFYKYLINIMNISMILPLGISYYTLSLLSYLCDVYYERYKEASSLVDFMIFSFYFPCLFIGPINRYDKFHQEISNISFIKNNFFDSLLRIAMGLIKKIIIANKLSVVINSISNNTSYSGIYVLIACILYSVMLYCDFSGGIDIVLGISNMFNIHLMENFQQPFHSESIKEFWRRWHISLGTWLKDYIYIPLGGSKGSKCLTKINVLITFIVSGAWHGLHYLLWGVLNGILVICNWKTKYKFLNIFLTFFLISLLWIFFIYNNTFLSCKMFITIFTDFHFSSIVNFMNLGLNIYDWLIIVGCLGIIIFYDNKKDFLEQYFKQKSWEYKIIVIMSLIIIVLLFGNYGLDVNSNNFIYGSF